MLAGKRTSIVALAASVVLIAGTIGYLSWHVKKPAPAVIFASLTGEKISTQDLRGKVVMVNFWSTSCAICVRDMPRMVETYNKYNSKGLELVAVAMRHDPPNYVLNYAQTRSLPFRVALDLQGDLARSFGEVQATPTTFIIDRAGNIIRRYVGEPDFAALHGLLEKVLAEEP